MAKKVEPPKVTKADLDREAAEKERKITELWELLPQVEKERILRIVTDDAGERFKKIHDDFDLWLDNFDIDSIKHSRWMILATAVGVIFCTFAAILSIFPGHWIGVGLYLVNATLFYVLTRQAQVYRSRHIESLRNRREERREKLEKEAVDKEALKSA